MNYRFVDCRPTATRAALRTLCKPFVMLGLATLIISSAAFAQTDPLGPPPVATLAQGEGWRLIDPDPEGRIFADGQMWQVSEAGIDRVPISELQRKFVREAFEDSDSTNNDGSVFFSATMLEALEDPTFPKGYEQYIDPNITPDPSGESRGACGWDRKSYTKSFSFSEERLNYQLPLGNGLDGQVHFGLPVRGNADVTARYEIRKCLGIPVGLRFHSGRAVGNLTVEGSGGVEASFTYADDWRRHWEYNNIHLGSAYFFVGPVPVRLEFDLPLAADLVVSVTARGNFVTGFSGSSTGTFEYDCTTRGCAGGTQLSNSFVSTSPTASVEATADAKLSILAMVRASLYDDAILYVQGGAEVYARGSLWGYAGNACGDADGDGNNEFVTGLAADAFYGYQFAYGWGGALLSDEIRYTGGSERHLGWYDLLGHSSAFDPILAGPGVALQGDPLAYSVSMRPCHPYSQPVTAITTGLGSGNTTIPPGGSASIPHLFVSPGNQQIAASAVSDSYGRSFGTTSRVVRVNAAVPTSPWDLSTAASAPNTVRLTWRQQSPYETHFEIQRRLSPSGSYAVIGTVAENVTSFTDATVLPATTYEYRVRAMNGTLASPFTNTLIVTMPPVSTAQPEIRVAQDWDGVELPIGSSLQFGQVATGPTTSRRIRICNDGTAPLVLNNPTSLVSGNGFSQIVTAASPAPVTPVLPGTCSYTRARFQASVPGSYAGLLSISNNDPNEATYTVALGAVAIP